MPWGPGDEQIHRGLVGFGASPRVASRFRVPSQSLWLVQFEICCYVGMGQNL